jgi:hypothetical protein
MLTASKNGRKIAAMVMKDPVDRCLGVVQCALDGCEAHMAIVEIGAQRISGNVEDQTPKEQVAWFLEHHECRAPRVRTKVTNRKKGR